MSNDSRMEQGMTDVERSEFAPVAGEPWEHIALRFRAGMAGVQITAHRAAQEKGWWDGAPRTPLELIALIHEELSELGRAARKGNPESDKIPGHSQMAEEAADVVIRLLDACTFWGIDLGAVILDKMEYNRTRPYRHGGLKY